MDINSLALQHQSVLLGFSWEVASGACQWVTVCLQALPPSSRAVTQHREINPTLWAQRGSKKVLGVSPVCFLTLQSPQGETQTYSSHQVCSIFIPNPGRHHPCRRLRHDVQQ